MKNNGKDPKPESLLIRAGALFGGLTTPDAKLTSLSNRVVTLDRNPESVVVEGAQPISKVGSGLDAAGFTLFNWNIKKGEIENWDADLMSLAGDVDLVLIQEATQQMDAPRFVGDDAHWSFSQGYSRGKVASGVATISSVQPIEHSHLLTVEPWLRTPKATMATRFAIQGREETLLVVNTHMVNFTLGHSAFRRQLADVEGVLNDHVGPIIFSGDFNTWRQARYEILLQMTSRYGLTPTSFDSDHRTTFFGSAVDHIFISGLSVEESTTFKVNSSDHNPMSMRLYLSI